MSETNNQPTVDPRIVAKESELFRVVEGQEYLMAQHRQLEQHKSKLYGELVELRKAAQGDAPATN